MPYCAELRGKQPDLVRLVRLRGAVGDVVRPREEGVLADDVHEVAAHALVAHRPGELARDEERAARHDVVLEVPVADVRLEQRLRDRQTGVVDDDVDAAEGEQRRLEGGGDLRLVGDVAGDADRAVGGADLARDRLRIARIDVGDDDARAFGCEAVGDGPSDPRAAAGHERDAGRERPGLGQAGQLGLLERPVLDAELLRSGIGAYVLIASAPRMTLIALT